MIHTSILISAISKASIVFVIGILALAVIGLVVDIKAKKKGNAIKLEVEQNTNEAVLNTEDTQKEEIPLEEELNTEEVQEEATEENVEIKEPPVEETPEVEKVPVEETPVEVLEQVDTSGKGFVSNAYSRSYTSKLIQSDVTTQERYSAIKNELLSYAKMRSSIAWTNETFRTGNKTVARIMLRGKTVLLLLALDPNEFTTTKYAGEDVSDVKRYANTPMRLRVTSERRLKYALELIALLVGREGYEKNSYTPVQYSYEYQTDEQLIEAGLIKVE